MSLAFITILAVTAILSWWLSGYDANVTGEDKSADLLRRVSRCGITLVLMGFGAGLLLNGGVAGGFIFFLTILLQAIIWVSCASELSARLFHGLVDGNDQGEFDPKRVSRDLNRLAGLIRDGRNEEAIELCRQLQESNEVSPLAMETMLLQLYQQTFADDRIAALPSLAEARRLRGQKLFTDAIANLDALLKKEPKNLAAAVLLMRIHAQDLQRPDQAHARLQILAGQLRVPPAFTDYARRCIDEWCGAAPRKEKSAEGVESLLVGKGHSPAPQNAIDTKAASVDELLAAGHLATAIEILENKVRTRPRDFGSWMKLAEAHGVYCDDVPHAAKIVEKIAANPAFDPEQIELAMAELNEWKARRRS